MRTHKETAAILFFSAYIVAMAFFAVIRAFGLLWFRVEYVPMELPEWAGAVILLIFLYAEFCIVLRILTSVKWGWIACMALAVTAVDFVCSEGWQFWLLDLAICLVIPLIFNKDKRMSIGYSLMYIAGINLYQGLMMLGRGYPMLAKFDVVWQTLGTIDYRFFLLSILALKGVVKMQRGCMFFFGKFDRFAAKIGGFILRPFTRKHDA